MQRAFLILALACTAVAGCCGTNGPSAPTPGVARLSRTRFMAFGDSFTAGEVTNPITQAPGLAHRLVLLPTASYPSVLQGQLHAAYTSQASAIASSTAASPASASSTAFSGFQPCSTPAVRKWCC